MSKETEKPKRWDDVWSFAFTGVFFGEIILTIVNLVCLRYMKIVHVKAAREIMALGHDPVEITFLTWHLPVVFGIVGMLLGTVLIPFIKRLHANIHYRRLRFIGIPGLLAVNYLLTMLQLVMASGLTD
jgi:hypothetical protein